MKIKSFIFVLFLFALVLISTVAIEQFKYGKQTVATEESNTKIGVKSDIGWGGHAHSENQGGRHGDGYWGAWTEKRGIKGEEENELRGRNDEAKNKGPGGDGEGETEGGWGKGENGWSGGGGQVGLGQKGKT